MTGSSTDPYRSPDSIDSPPALSPRFVRANRWAVWTLCATGIPALVIVAPVLIHEFGVSVPRILRLFSPKTGLFIMYPEMIAFPSAILAWIVSWVLPIDKEQWLREMQQENAK